MQSYHHHHHPHHHDDDGWSHNNDGYKRRGGMGLQHCQRLVCQRTPTPIYPPIPTPIYLVTLILILVILLLLRMIVDHHNTNHSHPAQPNFIPSYLRIKARTSQMCVFPKKFSTFDPHRPVLKKTFFF